MWKQVILISVIFAIRSCDSLAECNLDCLRYYCFEMTRFSDCVKNHSKCRSRSDDCDQETCFDECKKDEPRMGTCYMCYENCEDDNLSCDDSRKAKIIIGVVVGVAFLICVIVGVYCYQKRKRLRQKIQNQSQQATLQQNFQNAQMQQDFQQQQMYQNQMIQNSNQIPPPYFGYNQQGYGQQQQMFSNQQQYSVGLQINQQQAKQIPINQAVI